MEQMFSCQCSHFHAGVMQTCCCLILLVFLPKIDLGFLSSWSCSCSFNKVWVVEGDRLKLLSFSIVPCGPCSVPHGYGIERTSFHWLLKWEGIDGVSGHSECGRTEMEINKRSPWLKGSPTTTWIALLLPNQSSWPQIEGDATVPLFPSHPLILAAVSVQAVLQLLRSLDPAWRAMVFRSPTCQKWLAAVCKQELFCSAKHCCNSNWVKILILGVSLGSRTYCFASWSLTSYAMYLGENIVSSLLVRLKHEVTNLTVALCSRKFFTTADFY